MKLLKTNSIKNLLRDNKIYFETLAAFALSFMAIMVSIQQCNTMSNQTTIMNKQLELLKNQDSVQRKQYSTATQQLETTERFNEFQNQIFNKQTNLLEVQTNFLYTPNLEVEFSVSHDPKLILRNDGKNEIIDIRIKRYFGLYDFVSNTFGISLTSKSYWKQIKKIKPGAFLDIPIDTERTSQWFNFEQNLKHGHYHNGVSIPDSLHAILGVECFIIKYKSGPDIKEHTLKKYLTVDKASNSGKIMYWELNELYMMKEVYNAVRSTEID
jgi:hypothetical protein